MVGCCCHHPDLLVQPCRWLLGHLYSFKMHQSSTLLHRSRSTKHTYRYRYALPASSNGMGPPHVASPKDTIITHFLDRGVVSQPLIHLTISFMSQKPFINNFDIISVIVASLYRIVFLHHASRTDPLCKRAPLVLS